MAATTTGEPQAPGERAGAPLGNPLPLSASQEAQVRDLYYARVRRQCADQIKAFADCALGRTFSVSFACRAQHRAMNGCMKQHATQAEHDAAREEWFALRLERRRQRERKARMAAAQQDFIRDWWGLTPQEKESEAAAGGPSLDQAAAPSASQTAPDGSRARP